MTITIELLSPGGVMLRRMGREYAPVRVTLGILEAEHNSILSEVDGTAQPTPWISEEARETAIDDVLNHPILSLERRKEVAAFIGNTPFFTSSP